MTKEQFEKVWKDCRNHHDLLLIAYYCQCFHCLKAFTFRDIKKWIDKNGKTALCPHCGIDAVIPEQLDDEHLKLMQEQFFGLANATVGSPRKTES